MRYLTLLLALIALQTANATPRGAILEITRAIALSSKGPLPEKDYYLSIGERDGLQAGDIVEVFRSYPVLDEATGMPARMIRVDLGKLKILVLGDSHSIARESQLSAPLELPAMVSSAPILGDEVELVPRPPANGN